MNNSDVVCAPRRPAIGTCRLPPHVPGNERLSELKYHCCKLVERSILTLRAMPEPEARFLGGPRSGLPAPVVRLKDLDLEARLALRAKAPPWRPTAKDVDRYLECLSWLCWLERVPGGADAVKIITLATYGVPMWRISQRFAVSDRTVHRWRDVAFQRLTLRYWAEVERLM